MSVELTMTSEEWYNLKYPDKRLVIMDPDGWDRRNFQYSFFEEQITEQEFSKRVMFSTCLTKRNKDGTISL